MAARQELQTLYQRLGPNLPFLSCETGDGETVCRLQLPSVSNQHGSLPALEFTGIGKSKKLATANAAETALAYWKEQPLYKSMQPSDSISETLLKLFSDQGLRKEPEIEGHVLLAQWYNNGKVPLQCLVNARPVTQWLSKRIPEAKSPAGFLTTFQAHLQEHLEPSKVASVLECEASMRWIKRKAEYRGRDSMDIVNAMKTTVEHGQDKQWRAVMIPADPSQEIRKVNLSGGGYYLEALAEILGTSILDVLVWSKVGKTKTVYLPPDELQHEEPEKVMPSKRAKTEAAGGPSANGHGMAETDECTGDLSKSGISLSREELTEIKQPAGYTSVSATEMNLRASLLLRQRLQGDVIVSNCRMRPNEWRSPAMTWAHFSLPTFWAWIGAQIPSCEYAAACSAPQIAVLPNLYGSAKSWTGPKPSDLLASLLPPDVLSSSPICSSRAVTNDPDSAWDCSLSMQIAGTNADMSVLAEGCATEDISKQQAALQMIQRYENELLRLLKSGAEQSTLDGLNNVQILKAGDSGESLSQDAVVRFEYRIESAQEGSPRTELAQSSAKFIIGSQALIPAVEHLVRISGVGGVAQCHLLLPRDCRNPFVDHKIPCLLQIRMDPRLKSIASKPSGAQQNVVSLFDPSMAKQRHGYMAELLKIHDAQTVLDIGCGDGRLVEHLLSEGHEGLERVVGLDLDGQAVSRGMRRILRQSETARRPGAPALVLYQADVACKAAADPGVDAAVFQEVIEHLDPTPLGFLGACLLGALQPKLLLLSTPNFEYNAVLHHLRNQLLPNGLRNSDHRFEWTRAQFEAWCRDASGKYGYDVSFQALGHACEEAVALEHLSIKDVGGSTQVAIFKRQGAGSCSAAGHPCTFDQIYDSALKNCDL